MLDLLFKGGRVYTGAGNPWLWANVGVKGDTIAYLGPGEPEAAQTVDASGLVVAPGFIDLHDHSDLTILADREATSKVWMGVSTTTFASCGSGAAPLDEEMREEIRRTSPFLEEARVEVDWSSMEEYLARLESGGISVNVAPLVGFSNIRRLVMGMEMRSPTAQELEEMKTLAHRAMEAGCRGISTGLRYDPQSYASTEEVVEIAKVVASHRGIYSSHIRDEGDRGDPESAFREAITIAREAGIPVNISHIKVLSKRLHGAFPRLLEMVEEARREGLQITADQYPYTASGTGLQAWIPKWANEGGPQALLERLRDPQKYVEIGSGLASSMEDRGGPEAALIGSYPADPGLVGKTVAEVAQERGEDPLDCALGLLRSHLEATLGGRVEGGFSIVNFNQSEENVEAAMRKPWVAFGSDGRVHSPRGPLARHIPAPHPRFYGTFPRVLGRYVREKGVLTLEEALRKMTSLPAQILGLADRGILAPGFKADIVAFDPDTVADTAQYAPPQATTRKPTGIHHLAVNGVLTMLDGEHTGARGGRVLRSTPMQG